MSATITSPTPAVGSPVAGTASAVRPSVFSEVRETARRRVLAASALVVGLAAVTAFSLALISLGVAA
ncbi:hypothetical protein [Curtobacterium aetherium]|uniref:Uncharacterized protein n=1 Tax=Curtobacterium aetherium TaxID=2841594 RepID=A0ACD1E4D5_9MICO|nr:hypothetical protein [Curtobacterium sp. L6-1]QWS33739.1 hypothetical protein KM842_00490 [Curtobacterium sp. L6-1]